MVGSAGNAPGIRPNCSPRQEDGAADREGGWNVPRRPCVCQTAIWTSLLIGSLM